MVQKVKEQDRPAHDISKAYYVIDPKMAEAQQRDMSSAAVGPTLPRLCGAGVE